VFQVCSGEPRQLDSAPDRARIHCGQCTPRSRHIEARVQLWCPLSVSGTACWLGRKSPGPAISRFERRAVTFLPSERCGGTKKPFTEVKYLSLCENRHYGPRDMSMLSALHQSHFRRMVANPPRAIGGDLPTISAARCPVVLILLNNCP
jgi:hypothetical protein